MTLENKLKHALKSNDINKIHGVFDEIYTNIVNCHRVKQHYTI